MAECCRKLSKVKVFHIFGPTYAKDNCLHFVPQNGILYANFCLVQYLCVMGDNTNTSLKTYTRFAVDLNVNILTSHCFKNIM